MSENRADSVIEVLTRSVSRRDVPHEGGGLSDEDLILRATGGAISAPRLRLLTSLSRLLRLMDGLLAGQETGEGFVAKFSDQWLALKDWESDPVLEAKFEQLNRFYSEIQLFCGSAVHRQEEPLLFDPDRLKALTQAAYDRLMEAWRHSLASSVI